jgi:hypothetical protein
MASNANFSKMPNINIPGSGHVAPASAAYQYLPYTNVTYLQTLREAISIIDTPRRTIIPWDEP